MRTIQHIAVADEWQDALESGEYIWSTRGMTIEQVGYLHASFPEQVRPTLERFYADVDAPLVLLTLDTDAIVAAGFDANPRCRARTTARSFRTSTVAPCRRHA